MLTNKYLFFRTDRIGDFLVSAILINSIKNRLVYDVPVGVFMSSGIDSGLISTLIKKELNR